MLTECAPTFQEHRSTLWPGRTLPDSAWCEARDGDPEAYAVFRRHYSYRSSRIAGRAGNKFMGPGYYLALITPERGAIFGWRLFRSMDRQDGVCCAYFRNERADLYRSSELIGDADGLAWSRWPQKLRHYTYVNARKVKSPNPGFCFLAVGWRRCGLTKRGLVILERLKSED